MQRLLASAAVGLTVALTVTALPAAWQPAEAQGVGTLRSQTQTINRAIRRQVQQALRPTLTIRRSTGPVTDVATSADGRYTVTVLGDATARLWDAQVGGQMVDLQVPGTTRAAVAPTGILLGSSTGQLGYYDLRNGGLIRALAGGHAAAITALVISADGRFAASGDQTGVAVLWDLTGGTPLARVQAGTAAVSAVAISPLGDRFAAGSGTTAQIIGAQGQPLAQVGNSGQVSALAFDANGGRLYVTTDARELRVADAASGAQIGGFQNVGGRPAAIAAGPAGVIVAAADGMGLTAWDATTGQVLRQIPAAHAGTIRAVAVDAQNAQALTASDDSTARVNALRAGTPDQPKFIQLVSTQRGSAVIDETGRFDGDEAALEDVAWTAANDALELDNFSKRYFEPGVFAKHYNPATPYIQAAPQSVRDAILPPPAVSFASQPQPAGNQIQVVINAQDQGGGITEVRLFHNGKRVAPAAVTSDTGAGQPTRTVSFAVAAVPGLNSFEARALGDRDLESVPATAQIQLAAPARLPTLHALVVGINNYTAPELKLDYAARDATVMQKSLQLAAQPLFSELKVYPLIDENANKAGILRVLDGMVNLPPEDVVVIYVAGHGLAVNNTWYFLPHDYSSATFDESLTQAVGISTDQLRDLLVNFGPRQIVLVMDACYSGAALQGIQNFAARADMRELGRDVGLHVLAATRDDQVAYELPELGQGLLTYTILQGIRGSQADRLVPDGQISAAEIIDFAKNNLTQIARAKYPQIDQQPTGFSAGADFPIFKGAN